MDVTKLSGTVLSEYVLLVLRCFCGVQVHLQQIWAIGRSAVPVAIGANGRSAVPVAIGANGRSAGSTQK